MNHLYLQLGRAIAAACSPGFQQAVLEAAIGEAEMDLRLARDGETVGLDEAGRRDILAALTAVRDAQAEADGKAWSSCTVTLSAGGGFAMDVGYPDEGGPERRDGLQILTR